MTEVISWDIKHSNNKDNDKEVIICGAKRSNHIDKDKEVISWDVNHSNHGSPGLTARSLGRSALTVIGGIKLFVLISKTNTMTKKIDKKTNAYTSTNTNATTNATTKKSSFGIQSTEANI